MRWMPQPATFWQFEPPLKLKNARGSCCDLVNRGVAVWKGMVYVGSFEGVLYALDARDGAIRWQADTFIDHKRAYSITGTADRGQGGGDRQRWCQVDSRGYVSAYDLQTGRLAWRFYTVPGDPAKPYENKALEIARLLTSYRCAPEVRDAAFAAAGLRFAPAHPPPDGTSEGARSSGEVAGRSSGEASPACEVLFWRCENERSQAQAVAAEIERLVSREQVGPGGVAVIVGDIVRDGQTVAVALEERAVPHRGGRRRRLLPACRGARPARLAAAAGRPWGRARCRARAGSGTDRAALGGASPAVRRSRGGASSTWLPRWPPRPSRRRCRPRRARGSGSS